MSAAVRQWQDHIRDMKGFGFTAENGGKPEDVKSMLHKAELGVEGGCLESEVGKVHEQ